MAFQTSQTKLIGRKGNIIGYRRRYDGAYLARIYPGKPRDPKTPAQKRCRNKLSFASTFVSNLGKVGCEIQLANGVALQWRKLLVGKVMKCFPVELPAPPFPCRLPLVDTPGIKVDYPQISFVRQGATLTLHVGLHVPPAYRLHRCATAIIVYNTSKNLWLSTSDLRTTLTDLHLTLPKSWLTDTLLPAAFILPSFEPLNAPDPADLYSNNLDDLQQLLWAPLHCLFTTTSPRPKRTLAPTTSHPHHTLLPSSPAPSRLHIFTSTRPHHHPALIAQISTPRPLALLSTSLRHEFDSTSHFQHSLFTSPFPSCSRAFQRRSRRCPPKPHPNPPPPHHLLLVHFSDVLGAATPIPSPPFPAHLRWATHHSLPSPPSSPPVPVHFSDVLVAATPIPPSPPFPAHLRWTRILLRHQLLYPPVPREKR